MDIELANLDLFADPAVIIRAWTKIRPIQQWSVALGFKRRLKKRFDLECIEIPCPHQIVCFGQDRQSQPSPARVRMKKAQE